MFAWDVSTKARRNIESSYDVPSKKFDKNKTGISCLCNKNKFRLPQENRTNNDIKIKLTRCQSITAIVKLRNLDAREALRAAKEALKAKNRKSIKVHTRASLTGTSKGDYDERNPQPTARATFHKTTNTVVGHLRQILPKKEQ